MGREYKKLSNNVILSKDNKGNDLYFTRVDSAASFNNIFYDEESDYTMSAKDIEIQTGVETYTDAVMLTFCYDALESDNTYFIDVIICGMIGTFISDRY